MNQAPSTDRTKQLPQISIAGRKIGDRFTPFVIAELSGNHNGDIERAFAIMEAARAAGAHAIKFQTYTADTITIDHDGPEFTISGGLWDGRTLYELYQEAHTPWEWHPALFAKARELDLIAFSSPFDSTAVDFLETLEAPAYKIASLEIVDHALIRKVAETGMPVIISTGIATEEEVAEAVEVVRASGNENIALLHCISGYPTPIAESNLRMLPTLAEHFGTVVGLSDHTMGTTAPVAAIALGATIIEKHVTLSRDDCGPDAAFSLEPSELQELCTNVLSAWQALGQSDYEIKPSETATKQFRRSLYVVANIKAGELLTNHNIRSIRPGHGLLPKHLGHIMGRRAKHNIARGTALDWSHLE
jgi:pseudaminic acid synthase